jgi:hypothetical protein
VRDDLADNFVPLAHVEQLAARLPDARVRVLPGQSHLGGLDAADEVLDTILARWDRDRLHGAIGSGLLTAPLHGAVGIRGQRV